MTLSFCKRFFTFDVSCAAVTDELVSTDDEIQEIDVSQEMKDLLYLMQTVQDCWDHDEESRITASCAKERLARLKQKAQPPATGTAAV